MIVTRKEVARKAGVSTATVSRVLNKHQNVSDKTREKVLEIAKELDYKPNMMAKGLKTNRTYNLAFIIPDITNSFYTQVYKGIYAYALSQGFISSLYEMRDEKLFEAIIRLRPDGVVLGADVSVEIIKLLEDEGITVAAISGIENELIKLKTKLNLYQATIDLIKSLKVMGHKNIAMLTYFNENDERYNGYIDGLKGAGLKYDSNYLITLQDEGDHYLQGYTSMKNFLEKRGSKFIASKDKGDCITAALAYNDLVAIGAMKAIMEKGFKVPADISIVGFDDSISASYSNPALSTIAIPKYQQGKIVAELLIKKINNEKVSSVEMGTEFIIRDSIKVMT
ncbi:MAG: LacI family DNA-binding transcriptional regulator [Bacillota bacterium]